MKLLIFDSSTLISFAINGLFSELESLRKIFPGKFLLTQEVYSEVITKPMNIKKFELEAIKLDSLIKKGVFEFPDVLNISNKQVSEKTKEILDLANSTFSDKNQNIHIIDSGEASVMALSSILSKMKHEVIIAVDERTTRMMCESSENLKNLLEKKLHLSLNVDKSKLKQMEKCNLIRSSELLYVAWKKGIISKENPKILDALLWAVKLRGCSIGDDEIEEIKRLK